MAAAISPTGAGRALLLHGLRGELTLAISPLVLIESERNLQKKAPRALPLFEHFKQSLLASSVNPTPKAILQVGQVVALKDAPIVAAARRAKAEYLATYDQKHLLRQRELIQAHFGVQVVFPDEILKRLREAGKETR